MANESAGKSGKSVIMTRDKKFILKEIDPGEKTTLIEISQHYLEFLVENPKTLIAKIYGIFSLKLPNINKVNFIVMQNIDSFS